MFKLTIIPAIALAFFSACIQSQQVPEHSYPAEWESHEAIWLGFRSHEEAQDSVTVPMLRALTRHVDVHLVVESDSLIPDGIGFLANEGVDTSRVAVFLQSPTDFWFRDPGPMSVIVVLPH